MKMKFLKLLLFVLTSGLLTGCCAASSSSSSKKSEESESVGSSSDVGASEIPTNDYRVAFMSDNHLYDWDDDFLAADLFGMNSAARTMFAVHSILREQEEHGKIDLVVITGDVVNNFAKEVGRSYSYKTDEKGNRVDFKDTEGEGYAAGVFKSWQPFTYDGVEYVSRYDGVHHEAGASGTDNDPRGLLRILSFIELMQPFYDDGIRVIFAHGNHDCYTHSIFEMGFGLNQLDGYVYGDRFYDEDKNGNLLVPSYELTGNELKLTTKTVAPDDPAYAGYEKGYGKNYVFQLNDKTAFQVYDSFDAEKRGYAVNASGFSWELTLADKYTVESMMQATEDYEEVYIATHTTVSLTSALKVLGERATGKERDYLSEEIRNTPNVVCTFYGHLHMETAYAPQKSLSGKWEFICGYFAVADYRMQASFQSNPWSYRMLEKIDGKYETYIALPAFDYPEYTFNKSSGAHVDAFKQEYLRRGHTEITFTPNIEK